MIFAVVDPSPLTVCINCIFYIYLCISGQMYTVEKPNCNWRRPPYSTANLTTSWRRVRSAYDVCMGFWLGVRADSVTKHTHNYITKYLIGKVSTINRQTKQGVTEYSDAECTYCLTCFTRMSSKTRLCCRAWVENIARKWLSWAMFSGTAVDTWHIIT